MRVIQITASELTGAVDTLKATNQVVEAHGFGNVLSCLATIAHTNSRLTDDGRFREDQDEREFWAKMSRKLYKQAHKFDPEEE